MWCAQSDCLGHSRWRWTMRITASSAGRRLTGTREYVESSQTGFWELLNSQVAGQQSTINVPGSARTSIICWTLQENISQQMCGYLLVAIHEKRRNPYLRVFFSSFELGSEEKTYSNIFFILCGSARLILRRDV